MDAHATTRRWPFILTLLLVLLVAVVLRLYRLPGLPFGLHYDEAANGILAGEIARGINIPIFIPSYTGKEVLFFYWAALWMQLLGVTTLALRLSAALVGIATIAATAWVVYELLYNHRGALWIALLTAAFVATSFWHLILSRYGFRAITQPLLQALTVAALWRGLRAPPQSQTGGEEGRVGSLPWLLLAGLICGLTTYTYLAARAFPIPLAAGLLTLFLTDRSRRQERLVQSGIFIAVAALVLAPLAHYWLTHPGSFSTRVQQVAPASWREVWAGVRACLKMFFLRGDPDIRFNLPRRPLFDPVTAVLFLLGIIIVISRLMGTKSHRPVPIFSWVFLLLQLIVMPLPSALATADIIPNHLRAVGLLPFLYVFPALGLWNIADALRRLVSRIWPASGLLLPAFCLLLLIPLTFSSAGAYFGDWAPSARLYYAADGDLADIAAYLNQSDLDNTTPYVASVHYRHPTLAFLAQDYGAIRWLTGGRTIVFPSEGEALFLFPRSASKELDWVQSLLPAEARVAALEGPDGAPAFHAYRVEREAVGSPTHPLTANFGHVAQLLGYDVVNEPRSGGEVEVAVWWRVLNKPEQGDYGPVVRLSDPWGFVWGGKQPFHYPAEQWTPDELIIDHLTLDVAPGAPSGDYAVRFGFHAPSADARLPVLDEQGAYAGTSVKLPIHLGRAAGPPTLDDLDIRDRLGARADDLALLGVNLDTTSVRPGERLYLTLFWKSEAGSLPNYDIRLSLGDIVLYEGAPVHDTYPTSAWAAREIVADRYDPRLPLDTPPGAYALRLRAGDLSATLGHVTVQATDRSFEIPHIAHPLTASLGAQVELLGYDLSAQEVAPGEMLRLTLYWRVLSEMEERYTVFTHLVAPNGLMTGQRDSQPVGGIYPTSLWLPGEVVTDVYEIPVRIDAAPGEHRLEVGMYDAETGARLPVAGSADNAVVLQTLTVKE